LLVAIDEFCKQLVRSNPAAMAEWLLGVSGVEEHSESIAQGFYWQLIETELAAETQRADSVILHAGTATKPNQLFNHAGVLDPAMAFAWQTDPPGGALPEKNQQPIGPGG